MNEAVREKILDEIRFARTMRQILLKLGISVQENDFDDILMAIAEEARESTITKAKLAEFKRRKMITPGDNLATEYTKQMVESGGRTEPFVYDSVVDKQLGLLSRRTSRVNALESQIEVLDKQIISLEGDNA